MQIPPHDGTADGFANDITALTTALTQSATTADPPVELNDMSTSATQLRTDIEADIADAETALTASDVEAAGVAIDATWNGFARLAGLLLVNGVDCVVDADRATAAALNVPMTSKPWQRDVGYGSVWVSGSIGDVVHRVEPTSPTVRAIASPPRCQRQGRPSSTSAYNRPAVIAIRAASRDPPTCELSGPNRHIYAA